MNFEKPAFYNQPGSEEQINDNQKEVDYSPEDLQYLDQASEAAAEIIRWSLESKNVNRKIVKTNEGIRGYVSNTFEGGSVEGLFDGAKLSQVGIKLENGSETKQLSIQGLENGEEPTVFLDGQLVDSRDIPAVQRVVESIRQEISVAEATMEKVVDESQDLNVEEDEAVEEAEEFEDYEVPEVVVDEEEEDSIAALDRYK